MLVFILNRAVSDPDSPAFEPKQANPSQHQAKAPATVAAGHPEPEGTPNRTHDRSSVPRAHADSPPPKPRSKWWRPNRKPVPGRYKPRPARTARQMMLAIL